VHTICSANNVAQKETGWTARWKKKGSLRWSVVGARKNGLPQGSGERELP